MLRGLSLKPQFTLNLMIDLKLIVIYIILLYSIIENYNFIIKNTY